MFLPRIILNKVKIVQGSQYQNLSKPSNGSQYLSSHIECFDEYNLRPMDSRRGKTLGGHLRQQNQTRGKKMSGREKTQSIKYFVILYL